MIPNLAHGGAEKVLINLVNNMDRKKYDITVQTLFDTGVNRQFLQSHVNYKYCFKKQFRGNSKVLKLFSPKFLFKRFIKKKYDIIVSYLEGPTARIVSGCSDSDTKLVSWIHCTYKNKKGVYASFRSFDEAASCYGRYDITACVSDSVRESFIKALDFKGKICTVYNTNETEMIKEKSLENADDLELDKDYINLCSAGKVSAVKGFDRLARVHKRLLDDGIKNRVYIMGVGEQKKEIEDYLSANSLEDSFVFLGYRENPYKYIKKCDLYVCSSLSEGLSTSVTESLVLGVPVVTTLCSGMKELLGENNEYGIVTENSEEALYEGLKKVLTDKELLAHYAHMASVRGKAFDKSVTVKAAEDMFEELIKK